MKKRSIPLCTLLLIQVLTKFLILILEPNAEISEISQYEMDNFITMMEEFTGRNVFLDYLGIIFDKKDINLPCITSFDNI